MNQRTNFRMNRASEPSRIEKKLACLILLAGCTGALFAQAASETKSPTSVGATHILGFAGAPNNAGGTLSIEGSALKFQKTGGATVEVSVASIQDISLGVEDKQVGGTPMTLGKLAVPFGGGRAIGLVAHKKYDTLTVEYLDGNGGLHGAIFQLNKGKAEAVKAQLVAGGAHVSNAEAPAAAQANPEVKK